MPQATIPFDFDEMKLEASEVYVLAGALDIIRRIESQVGEATRYPLEFLGNLEGSLALLSYLVERTAPQLKKQ